MEIKETTCAEHCYISKVFGSKKGSRRSRGMETYKQKRNPTNLLHSRPLEEKEEEKQKKLTSQLRKSYKD